MKTAAFLGRFQPFHCGHLSIVTKILESFDHLILVIGSPNESRTDKNPWTVQEREEIMRAMTPLELQEKIDIISLSDNPSDDVWGENLKALLPSDCILFTGNEWTRDIAIRHGIQIEWIIYSIDISATRIRERLRCGEDVSEFTIVKSLPLLPDSKS